MFTAVSSAQTYGATKETTTTTTTHDQASIGITSDDHGATATATTTIAPSQPTPTTITQSSTKVTIDRSTLSAGVPTESQLTSGGKLGTGRSMEGFHK